MQIAMIQDRMVALSELEPVYLDRGVFFGDGVYEVIRSYKGRIFALDEHLGRFANSLAGIGIEGVDIGRIRGRLLRAFEAAGIAEAKIYFHVTRGSGPREHVAVAGTAPNFFLTVTDIEDAGEVKAHGIAVSTHPDWRWKRCDIKSLNLLANVLARQDAARKGCSEAILVDDGGLITEGAASAFFAIIGGVLRTRGLTRDILPSITREFIVRAASKVGVETVEESLTVQEATGADELFLGVTTKDIVPVVKFDGEVIGDGRPGRYTEALMAEFRSFTV